MAVSREKNVVMVAYSHFLQLASYTLQNSCTRRGLLFLAVTVQLIPYTFLARIRKSEIVAILQPRVGGSQHVNRQDRRAYEAVRLGWGLRMISIEALGSTEIENLRSDQSTKRSASISSLNRDVEHDDSRRLAISMKFCECFVLFNFGNGLRAIKSIVHSS